jgi:DNA polymerase I
LRSRMYAYSDEKEGKRAKAAIQIQLKRLLYRKIGYVTTPFGRRLVVDAHKAYTAVNYKVQSTAADLMKHALLDVMADPELEPTVLLLIHDEILGQARKREAEYIAQRYGEVMTREFMGVPITATGKVYGKSWGHGYMEGK